MGIDEGITWVSATNNRVLIFVLALILFDAEELGLVLSMTDDGGGEGVPGVIHEKLSVSLSSWAFAFTFPFVSISITDSRDCDDDDCGGC